MKVLKLSPGVRANAQKIPLQTVTFTNGIEGQTALSSGWIDVLKKVYTTAKKLGLASLV